MTSASWLGGQRRGSELLGLLFVGLPGLLGLSSAPSGFLGRLLTDVVLLPVDLLRLGGRLLEFRSPSSALHVEFLFKTSLAL